jgi:CRISPR-associated endoribonuclease Cas6
MVFPLPRLVFGSLLSRWNHCAPLPLAPELVEAFDTGIDVDRYTLNTQMQDFGRYQLQVGFVGQCTFGTRKGVAAEVVWGMQLLAAFAFFAGVGYRTTMGMGQVRLLG